MGRNVAERIPADIIEKIRDEVAIEDVIGHFVPLKPKGGSFWGRCPFHDEKTPSFHVHPGRQIYFCFGCRRGGNVYRFLMDREGMSFPEAVQWCASRIGLDLTRFLESEGDAAESQRTRLFTANQAVAEWFASNLAGPEGKPAREYARERGLRPESIEHFQLGFAPSDGSALMRFAAERGLGVETLLAAQLLRREEGREPFAYFRSRLIFPLQGVGQKIHGFGGRILGPGEPKYLNSPETSVFQKRSTLYALPSARKQVIKKRSVILVEGYLDAIALHQAGWTETVATCGTAFTAQQAAALSRYAERVIILFDGDAAGQRAAFKSADVALAGGLDVRIARLPQGQDPADLVKAKEEARLQEVIVSARGLVDALAEEVSRRGDQRSFKERAIGRLRESLALVADEVRKELLVQEAAQRFSIPATLLREGVARPAPGQAKPAGPAMAAPSRRAELERRALMLGMANAKARRELLQQVEAEEFESAVHRELWHGLGELSESIETPRLEELTPESAELEGLIAGLLAELPDVDSGFDVNAELRSTLRVLRSLEDRAEAAQGRELIGNDYMAGGERWREELARRAAAKQGRDADS